MFSIWDIFQYVEYKTYIHRENCLHKKSTKSSCTRCIEICPVEAISLKENDIVISDACTNCNYCVGVCPSGALLGTEISVCRKDDLFYLGYGNISRACIETLSLDYLAKWYKEGIRRIVSDQAEVEGFLEKLNFFNFLLKINGMREINFQIEKEKEDSQKVYARSELIESGINEIKKLGFCLLGKKENTAKFFLKFWESLPTKASLYGIEIDNRCSHCRACILLCTNQALEAKEKVEQTGFCNGCGLCIEICPQKAIILKKNNF